MRRAFTWKGAKGSQGVTVMVIVSTKGMPKEKTDKIAAELSGEVYLRIKNDFSNDDINYKPE